MKLMNPQNTSFFTEEEISKFKILVKKHLGIKIDQDTAEDQFLRLFLLVSDIVEWPQSGTIDV